MTCPTLAHQNVCKSAWSKITYILTKQQEPAGTALWLALPYVYNKPSWTMLGPPLLKLRYMVGDKQKRKQKETKKENKKENKKEKKVERQTRLVIFHPQRIRVRKTFSYFSPTRLGFVTFLTHVWKIASLLTLSCVILLKNLKYLYFDDISELFLWILINNFIKSRFLKKMHWKLRVLCQPS